LNPKTIGKLFDVLKDLFPAEAKEKGLLNLPVEPPYFPRL
jgi:hypothetical protein